MAFVSVEIVKPSSCEEFCALAVARVGRDNLAMLVRRHRVQITKRSPRRTFLTCRMGLFDPGFVSVRGTHIDWVGDAAENGRMRSKQEIRSIVEDYTKSG